MTDLRPDAVDAAKQAVIDAMLYGLGGIGFNNAEHPMAYYRVPPETLCLVAPPPSRRALSTGARVLPLPEGPPPPPHPSMVGVAPSPETPGLREAIDDLIAYDLMHPAGGGVGSRINALHEARLLDRAVPASPETPGLDVERLARALANLADTQNPSARLIAREYARLSDTTP